MALRMNAEASVRIAAIMSAMCLQTACNLPALQHETGNGVDMSAVAAVPEDGGKPHENRSFRPPPKTSVAADVHRQRRPLIRELGTEQYVGTQRQTSAATEQADVVDTDTADDGLVLNFQQTDLREFVKAVLGDVLKLNYILDPKVGGEVTMETTSALPRAQLFSLVEEVLALNGAAMVRKGELYEILPRARAIAGRLSPSISSKTGHAVRLVPLRYVSASELQEIIKPFAAAENQLRIDTRRNLMILSGTRAELDLMEETIRLFDVDWMKGNSIGLYPLDHISPKEMEQDLRSILGGGPEGGEGMLQGLLRTVAIERLNSILLIGTTTAALREGELWLYRLDQPGPQIGRRLYVYPIQNAKAVELAEILNQVFTSVHERRTEDSPPALAPGTEPVRIGAEDVQAQNTESPSTDAARPPAASAGTGVVLPTTDSIEIIADDTRNALVILAEPQDYRMVEAAIRKLDIVPLQVLIQAGIVEVTLTDELSFGVGWFFRNALGGDREGNLQLDLDDAPGINFGVPSLSYTIVNNADQIRLALNALAGETEVNVLSTPSLMVLDNQTAKINVGDEIPVPTRQSSSNVDPSAPTVNEIEFRKTGVTLTVTPRVNNSGLVTMEIQQSVSDAVQTLSSGLDAPTIQQRELQSTIAVNSGETLVLGGLIRDRNEQRNSGVPWLRKLPLVGKFFSTDSRQNRRTELLVLITPRVSRNREDARGITEELKRQLRSIRIEQEPEPS